MNNPDQTEPCPTGAIVCYKYNALGQMVQFTALSPSRVRNFAYSPSGQELGQYTSGAYVWDDQYVPLGGRQIAKYYGGSLTDFVHPNHLGSTSIVTDQTGTPVRDMLFYPWGQTWRQLGSNYDSHFAGFQQREFNSGLDPTLNRMYHSRLFRWMSPDSIANDWEIDKPQTWNRYAYAHNNPLSLIDPEGKAVELIGLTDEERKKALEYINGPVGREAASRTYINEIREGDKTRYFVGIKGDVGEFMKLGETAHDLANLVQDKQVVEFGLTSKDLSSFGGAVTYDKGEVGNQNVRVLVNPQQAYVADRVLDPRSVLGMTRWAGQMRAAKWTVNPFTPEIMLWHEFGHGWGSIHGRTGGKSNSEADAWENRMRQQIYGPLGPDNAPRVAH